MFLIHQLTKMNGQLKVKRSSITAVTGYLSALLLILGGTAPAFANHKLHGLQFGNYVRTQGSEDLCPDFFLKPKSVTANRITLTVRYSFSLQDYKKITASDLDPKCHFATTNDVRTGTNDSLISFTDDEICGGKTVSQTSKTLEIREGKLKLESRITNLKESVARVCEWELKK